MGTQIAHPIYAEWPWRSRRPRRTLPKGEVVASPRVRCNYLPKTLEFGKTRKGDRMKTVFGAAIALLMALTLAGSVSAREDETVTKTFKLTLHGDVPADQAFSVGFNLTGADHTVLLPFCGRGTDTVCEGGGTVYTKTAEVQVGRSIDVRFVRADTDVEEAETFLSYTETLDSDRTNTAYYNYGGAGGGDQQGGDIQDDGQSGTGTGDGQEGMPSGLPSTGAGGLAGGGLPIGGAAVPPLLAAGAFALRRRL